MNAVIPLVCSFPAPLIPGAAGFGCQLLLGLAMGAVIVGGTFAAKRFKMNTRNPISEICRRAAAVGACMLIFGA